MKGTEDELLEGAIQKTISFFEQLGIPTKLAYYGIGASTAAEVNRRFTEKNSVFGEHGDIDGSAAEKILLMSADLIG